MSDFQELIKNIDKCRDYVRDFFVYGFKSRSDFPGKSARTYDDERRRIVSWLPDFVQEDFTEGGRSKNISLQIDQKQLDTNPLFSVWQTKSFTDTDLILHFFILKLLENAEDAYSAAELTDMIMDEFAYEADLQSVRRKCNEYVDEGLLISRKEGKTLLYSRGINFNELEKAEGLVDMIKCFQLEQPLGFIGNTILSDLSEKNDTFRVKHSFPTFTLEDEILLYLLSAIHEKKYVRISVQNRKQEDKEALTVCGLPLQIFVSTRSGRRFVCMYVESKKSGGFNTYRLDQIKEVQILEKYTDQKDLLLSLNKAKKNLWGVSFRPIFPGRGRLQKLRLTIHADEKSEAYILQRLIREGEGGSVTKIAENTFLYERNAADAMEMFPWIRSFTGRIVELKIFGTDGERLFEENKQLEELFFSDMDKMLSIYDIG